MPQLKRWLYSHGDHQQRLKERSRGWVAQEMLLCASSGLERQVEGVEMAQQALLCAPEGCSKGAYSCAQMGGNVHACALGKKARGIENAVAAIQVPGQVLKQLASLNLIVGHAPAA